MEEVHINPPIELVDVHGIDPIMRTIVLGLNPTGRIFISLFFVTMAYPQSLRYPSKHLVIETETFQQFCEFLL